MNVAHYVLGYLHCIIIGPGLNRNNKYSAAYGTRLRYNCARSIGVISTDLKRRSQCELRVQYITFVEFLFSSSQFSKKIIIACNTAHTSTQIPLNDVTSIVSYIVYVVFLAIQRGNADILIHSRFTQK